MSKAVGVGALAVCMLLSGCLTSNDEGTLRSKESTSSPLAMKVEHLTGTRQLEDAVIVHSPAGDAQLGFPGDDYVLPLGKNLTVTGINVTLSWDSQTVLTEDFRLQVYYLHKDPSAEGDAMFGEQLDVVYGTSPLVWQSSDIGDILLPLRDLEVIKLVVMAEKQDSADLAGFRGSFDQDYQFEVEIMVRPIIPEDEFWFNGCRVC